MAITEAGHKMELCTGAQKEWNVNPHRCLHPSVCSSIIHNSKNWKQVKYSQADKQTEWGVS